MGQLYVVARDRLDLYEELSRTLADQPDAQVILDRRIGDRRQRPGARTPDRRQAERRRAQPAVDANLRSLGWTVVRVR